MLSSTQLWSQNRCGNELNLQKLKHDNPAAYERFMKLEQSTNAYKQRLANNPTDRLINNNGLITIPVVVNVVHNGEALGTGRNISDAQIFNQIAILNADFNRLNADRFNTPNAFQGIAGNMNFQFVLACTDPNGAGTTGIRRVRSTTANFSIIGDYDCAVKHTNQGGIDAWPTDRYLNIWVFSLNGVAGVGTFPSDFQKDPNLDGVMVDFRAFGSGGSAAIPFELGRTTTHEIGHWLNLIHIWGDDSGACSGTDLCNDTPNQGNSTPPNVTPIFPNRTSCGNAGDMFMNFMDYSADRFMNMFSADQVVRARAVFQPGGPRSGFIDNYFSMVNVYRGCTSNYFRVNTPFCAANSNITWTTTGPITGTGTNQILGTFTSSANVNGVGTVTASWGNYITTLDVTIGYGAESSYIVPTCNNDYTTSFPVRNGTNTIVCPNSYMTGELLFTGATGPATSITLTSTNSSYVYFNASGNNFTLYISDPYAYAQIQALIPTTCGSRTLNYTFFANIPNGPNYYYRISPNPASNEITVSASMPVDPNNRTSNSASTPAYEVQIFNSFSQLLKKTKVKKDDREVTIDVSRFPSNQFYTVKLISNNDVQTKSFFKQ